MMVVPFQAFAFEPLELPEKTNKDFNGMFTIESKMGDSWVNLGSLAYGKFQETKELDLGEHQSNKNTLIKITQKGGGAAYLDSVFLDGATAFKANGTKSKVLNKLSKEDLDVTPVKDGIILEFETSNGRGILSVTGRIEDEIISKEPLQFPLANNYKPKSQIVDFYTYELNSNYGKITADGVLDEVEGMEVFAKEYQVPGSGHPAGDTYFWVMNDDENLYVVMDFTPDNTYDGDKDYAKVYVNTDEGIKEFKVSVPDTTYGTAGFTYTDKVVFEHKVYEFVIPLNELGSITDNLELAFVGYGTASLPEVGLPRLAYDSKNGIYLSVFQKTVEGRNQVWGQFVYRNDDNGTEVVCSEFVIALDALFPDVAYDTKNEAFLVVWEEGSSINCCKITIEDINKDEKFISSIIHSTEILYQTAYYVTKPAVAFDKKENKFLIVWEDKDWGDEIDMVTIKGMLLDLSKPLNDLPVLTISIPDYADDMSPSVGYSAEHEAFLVIWKCYDDPTTLQGNVITSTGNNSTPELLSDLIIIYSGNNPYAHSVSINEISHEFLITWGYDGSIYGANVYLSDPYVVSKAVDLLPEGSLACHSTAFYDGKGSMALFWNDISYEETGYIKMKTLGQNEVRGTYNPEFTYTSWSENNLIDSCGDGLGEILVAYSRYPEQDMSDFIGYRFISDQVPEFIDESQPALAYHSEFDIYLSVFTVEEIAPGDSKSYIYGQLVDNKGYPIGERFLVNDGTDNEDPEDDGCLQLPSVAVDKNGDFLVAWTQGFGYSKIYASKVSINKVSKNNYNVEVGKSFKVSMNTDYENETGYRSYDEFSPDIAYNSQEDNFLIVWTQYINDSPNYNKTGLDIYGSVVSIDGDFLRSTFSVTRNILEDEDQFDQDEVSVCYSAAYNKYIATWTETKDDDYSIYAVVMGSYGVYLDDKVVVAEDARNPNVSYNKDKFLITWSNYSNDELRGAYYNISGTSPEIINEEFVISALDPVDMDDVFPAAYYDGRDKMLCVWNPGDHIAMYSALNSVSFDGPSMYAQLRYIDSEGPVGDTFNTDNPEVVALHEPIAITGNLMGQFLIAYAASTGNEYYGEELHRISYRLIGELLKEPELEFAKDPYEVLVGETKQTELNYFDGIEYVDINYDKVTYFSGDTSIATISTGGAIKGIKVGTTTVSAIYATSINGVPTTLSAITNVEVYKKTESQPSGGGGPVKPVIIGQIIVDGEVVKDIYAEDLVSNRGIYSFEATKTGENAKLWLLGSYYNQISSKNPEGTLQLVWDAASYNLPLNSEEVLKEINKISNSKVNIILNKVTDKDLIDSAMLAVDKLGGKVVSGLVDFEVSIEGKTKAVNIDSYDMYVERTIEELNKVDAYSTTAMKLIEDNEFTFAPSVFHAGTARIKYRGNGIFAIVNNPKTFNDITNHWSRTNVEKLAARNIAFGKNEGVFAPNDYVTRAEFAVMITRALGITEEEGTMNFDDVSGWYAEDIARAYAAGLINGRGDGKFYPNERILRKDMAVMINNAIKFVGKEVTPKNTDEILSMFVDSSTIDEYAKECTAICVDAGIIMGRDTKEFDPNENATRAEASAIIERMLRYLDFIN